MNHFSLTDLSSWSKRCPRWQQETLRRLLEKGELDEADYVELTSLSKQPYEKGAEPPPLEFTVSANKITEPEFKAISLKCIREIAHAGALSEGPIEFSPEGLSVIYGDNGCGKSSLTRILKRLCRSLVSGGPIIGNINEEEFSGIARATVDYVTNETVRTVAWKDDATVDGHLDLINVFDAECARAQVARANDISYKPAVLQVIKKMVDTCTEVTTRLRAERKILGDCATEISELKISPITQAGIFLDSLNASSDSDNLRRLCELSPVETLRLKELTHALQDGPIARLESTLAQIDRAEEIKSIISKLEELLSDHQMKLHKDNLSKFNLNSAAAVVAQKTLAGSSHLPGTGAEIWRELWDSARRYSEQVVSIEQKFPVEEGQSRCVLCQQELSSEGHSRLKTFAEFVTSDTQKAADDARDVLEITTKELRDFTIPSTRRLLRDLETENPETKEGLRRFLLQARLRRRHILRRIDKPFPELPLTPDLESVICGLKRKANGLRGAADTDKQPQLMKELTELEDRQSLKSIENAISREIERLRQLDIIDRALKDCGSGALTRKAGQLADAILTGNLHEQFANNVKRLNFTNADLQISLGKGKRGSHPFSVRLSQDTSVSPAHVLSEGEATCVGLAGFFAELQTSGNQSGVLLDDPVSSLDHNYKSAVAKFIVQESAQRQVIVLTHDLTFLTLLRKNATAANTPLNESTLERGYKQHGVQKSGPPFIAMKVKDRLNWLEEELLSAKSLLETEDRRGYERAAEFIYLRIRKTWERAIEEVLLNNAVERFGGAVHPQPLAKVSDITEEDLTFLAQHISRCSNFAHDQAGDLHEPIPDPKVIQNDIDGLRAWVKGIRKRRG